MPEPAKKSKEKPLRDRIEADLRSARAAVKDAGGLTPEDQVAYYLQRARVLATLELAEAFRTRAD